MEGWTDTDGYDCSWYLNFDYPGCPFYGFLYPNEDGVDANAACCYCKDTDNECDIEGWTDFFGDDCSWYESNDSPGCPLNGSLYPNEDGVDANAACCYCKDTDNENPTNSPSQVINESSENPTILPSSLKETQNPTDEPSKSSATPSVPLPSPSTSSDSEANNNTPSSSSTVTGRLFVITFMILCAWV